MRQSLFGALVEDFQHLLGDVMTWAAVDHFLDHDVVLAVGALLTPDLGERQGLTLVALSALNDNALEVLPGRRRRRGARRGGLPAFCFEGVLITNAQIDALRDAEGV